MSKRKMTKMANEDLEAGSNIDLHFQLFLQRGYGDNIAQMHNTQLKEVKTAYYMAWAASMFVMRDYITDVAEKHGEEAASLLLDNMLEQVNKFLDVLMKEK